MKYFRNIWIAFILGAPVLTGAQDGPISDVQCEGFDCGFSDLLELIQDVILFLLKLSIPIAAIALAVAGFKIMTARDNAGARTEAKSMMLKIVGGVMIMLAAGLIVNTIVKSLLNPGYIFI